MNATNSIAANGLKNLRTANIISIIAIVFTMIGSFMLILFGAMGLGIGSAGTPAGQSAAGGMILAAGAGGLLALISLIIGLVAGIMQILALSKMSSVQQGYKTALIIVLVDIAVSLVSFFLPVSGVVLQLLNLIPVILMALVVYFVISATVTIIQGMGEQTLVDGAMKVRNLYIVSTAVMIVADLLVLIPFLAAIIGIVSLAASVVQIVALFKYIGFLGKASKALAS